MEQSRNRTSSGGAAFGQSTRRPGSTLPPPASAKSMSGTKRLGASAGAAGSMGTKPLSSKNWTYRPVVSKRDSLPTTQLPDEPGDLPPMWSTSKWGDVRRSKAADTSTGKRARVKSGPGGSGPSDIMIQVAGKEDELKKKLAAYASFNQTERDLLQSAFGAVSRERGGVEGLCTRAEFMEVFSRLGARLSPAVVDAFFGKYGEDRTGRMPVDLFVTAVLSSGNRIIAMEERRVGAYKANDKSGYAFAGRIKYWPCRKGVYAPSNWDPALTARSARAPKAGLSLEYVYGYGGLKNTANNLFYNKAEHAVYYTAAVGVVYDRHNHKQHFFHGHDDDIKCLALHPDTCLVATGQVASTSGPPIVCIWDSRVHPKTGELRGLVAQLPFEGYPSVIALQFSPDGERLVVVTGDVDHTVHVFDWKTADEALGAIGGGASVTTGEGGPDEPPTPGLLTVGKGGKGDSFPHVYGASWNPFGKVDGGGDEADAPVKNKWSEFVTYGARHIKYWRLHHKDDGIPYYGKKGSPGMAENSKFSPVTAPIDVMSVCWMPPRGNEIVPGGGSTLVAGTRDGDVLLFVTDPVKGLHCTRKLKAHSPGPKIPELSGGGVTLSGVRCLALRDDGETLVSGGGDGAVMWWTTAQLTAAARAKSVPCEPHTTRVLNADDSNRPPAIRALDCHLYSSDVIVGTYRCDIWEIDDQDGPHVMLYGHSADVRAVAVHPRHTHVVATGAESGRVYLWNCNGRVLKAKCNTHHPVVGLGFSPDGKHLAVGCKDGTLLVLNYDNMLSGEFNQVVKRADKSRCEFHHCNEAIDEVKYSPDGKLLAAGSHDNFIDIYDVTGDAVPGRSTGVRYHRLHRLKGHSSYVTHLDWSTFDPKFPDRRILQSTCGAYELLYYDGNTGRQVRHAMRDERWDTQTCTLGFSVMGIWPRGIKGESVDGTDVNACDRGPEPEGTGELLATVGDSGKVKLFNWPCVVENAPYRRMEWSGDQNAGPRDKPKGKPVGYVGHSSHVVNVRFANSGRNLISVGGHDRSVFQWRVDAEAKEQKGVAKRRNEPKPYIMDDLTPKLALTRVPDTSAEEENALNKSQKSDKAEQCDYIVTVVTGDAKGASTGATVVFSAAGVDKDGKTTVIREQRLDNSPENFSRGAKDVFRLRAADLGKLTHCRIGHNNAGENPGWLLQSVKVMNVTKGWEHTLFPRNLWLDRDRGGETTVTLYTSREDAEQAAGAAMSLKRYIVTVTTADVKGSGTDSNVWIDLVGVSGKSTGAIKLDNSANNFERNRVDRFEVEAQGMGTSIARARIGHDNSGFGASWCLGEVAVRCVESGNETVFDVPFEGIWLEDGGAHGTAVDIFPLGPDGKPTMKSINYKVEVVTSDVKFAGTDANVSIDIVGSKGTSGKRRLENSRNNFERNTRDVFFIEMPDLGDLTAINIGHDNSSIGAAWHLDKVIISDEAKPGKAYVFPAGPKGQPGGRWLEDGLCTVTLTPMDEAGGVLYSVTVQTSDVTFAGTDANVSITLIGEKDGKQTKSAPNVKLNNSKNNFERGALEIFDVGPYPDLGKLTAIEIGHDGTGMGSGWHCAYVEVVAVTRPDERFFFPIDAWFDVKEPPQKTRQLIKLGVNDPSSDKTTYKIDIHTSDMDNAGTDANVHVVVFGDKGDTGKLLMDTSADNFQRASKDTFSKTAVKNVGKISHIVVGHDEANLGPSWHVQQITVFNLATGETVTFNADCWVAKDKAPHYSSEVTLSPAGADPIKQCQYQVTVRTSDVRWAGTDATVSCRIVGDKGKTGMKELENGDFDRNSEDVFTFRSIDVGTITGFEIGHGGGGAGSDWHLSNVKVANIDRPEANPVFFFHDDWCKEDVYASLKPETSGGATCRYNIAVHTSDRRFAGTDSTVTAKLIGTKGESKTLTLENSANNFERARIDEFVVQTENIGKLTGVDIGIDGKGMGASWHLNMVTVANLGDGEKIFFHHNDWLQDKNLRVTLKPAAPGDASMHNYVVQVVTSDIRGSSCDANVSLVIFGDKGDSGELSLDNSVNNFERGAKDVFNVQAKDVGKIERIRIGHDDTGSLFGPASWHCASVEITNTTTGVRQAFSVNRWFSKGKTPNQISQIVYPGDGDHKAFGYVVTVHTADTRGAGTDANITLAIKGKLDGKKTAMGPLPLESSEDDFKRAAVDKFRVQGPKMGEITEAVLEHDGAGMLGGSDWHCRDGRGARRGVQGEDCVLVRSGCQEGHPGEARRGCGRGGCERQTQVQDHGSHRGRARRGLRRQRVHHRVWRERR